MIAERGRLVLLGSPRGASPAVNFYPQIHVRGISIVGAHADVRPARDRSPHHWTWMDDCELALRLLEAGRLLVAPMISTVYPWRQAAAAYEHLRRKDDENLGILFDWKNVEGEDG